MDKNLQPSPVHRIVTFVEKCYVRHNLFLRLCVQRVPLGNVLCTQRIFVRRVIDTKRTTKSPKTLYLRTRHVFTLSKGVFLCPVHNTYIFYLNTVTSVTGLVFVYQFLGSLTLNVYLFRYLFRITY